MKTIYSIDGLRVDTVPHVEKGFWQSFTTAVGDLYMVGEVFHGSPETVCSYQQYLPAVLNYPV